MTRRQTPRIRFIGEHGVLGFEVGCGTGRAASAGYGIRSGGKCRPPGHALLRLISGGR